MIPGADIAGGDGTAAVGSVQTVAKQHPAGAKKLVMLEPEENSGKPTELAAFHNVIGIKDIAEGIDKYRERAFGRVPAEGRRVIGRQNGDSGKN